MVDDSEYDKVFKGRCVALFRKMYDCEIESLPRSSFYSYDFVIHARDHDRLVKCISSDILIYANLINEIHSVTLGSEAESIIITNGRFADDAWEASRYMDPKMTLIDGPACYRLFQYHSIFPQNEYQVDEQCQNTVSNRQTKELTFKQRLLAVLVSLIIPGGGCFVLYAFTNDKRYIPLGIAFPAVSFILLQFTSVSNICMIIIVFLYIISIALSFFTLDLGINENSATDKWVRQARPKSPENDEQYLSEFRKRYYLHTIAIYLGIFIPGSGAAILFYIDRSKKHIIYGNLMFWPSLALVMVMSNSENLVIILAAIIILQIWSFIYTIRNFDEDIKESLIPSLRWFIPFVIEFIVLTFYIAYKRDPEFINSLFQKAMDLMLIVFT